MFARTLATAILLISIVSAAAGQEGIETMTLDGRVLIIPSPTSLDHYVAMCEKYVHRTDHKAECKVDMQVQAKLWDSLVEARRYASLAAIAGQPDEERYGMERARALLKQIDENEKKIKSAWPEILRPH